MWRLIGSNVRSGTFSVRSVAALRRSNHFRYFAASAADGVVKSDTVVVTPSPPSEAVGGTIDMDAVSAAISPMSELSYYPNHLVIKGIEYLHVTMDMPYWTCIVMLSFTLRICMTPLGIKTVQNGARMACLKPEMEKLTSSMKTQDGDAASKTRYQAQLKALFKQHDVNPLRAVAMPLIQLPLFISFFSALRQLGDYCPDVNSGGLLWFTDLSVPDPYYILPVVNAMSFMAMIELGSDGMKMGNQANSETVKWAMRGLGLAMMPMTATMPAGLFVYWTVNNAWSLSQTYILKRPAVKQYFNIPEAPVETKKVIAVESPMKKIMKTLNDLKTQPDDAPATVVDGSMGTGDQTVQETDRPKTFTDEELRVHRANNSDASRSSSDSSSNSRRLPKNFSIHKAAKGKNAKKK